MLTSLADVEQVRDDRPPYRPFRLRVSAIRALSPHFRRVTFIGPDAHLFGRDGLDQRIKLLLPRPGVPIADLGDDGQWYSRWLGMSDEHRPPLRTYTIRAVRPELGELDVDFVLHPDHGPTGHVDGPAARWLAAAQLGDEITIVGPDVRSLHSATGIDWRPGLATRLLLVGDETAVPAIAGIVASLNATQQATVLVELPDAADRQPLPSDAQVDVRWVVRDPDARGERLHAETRAWLEANTDVVRAAAAAGAQPLEDVDVDTELLWDSPDPAVGEFHAWLAGEAAMIKSLRRLLVTEHGIDRGRVAFMGYWRHGRAERN